MLRSADKPFQQNFSCPHPEPGLVTELSYWAWLAASHLWLTVKVSRFSVRPSVAAGVGISVRRIQLNCGDSVEVGHSCSGLCGPCAESAVLYKPPGWGWTLPFQSVPWCSLQTLMCPWCFRCSEDRRVATFPPAFILFIITPFPLTFTGDTEIMSIKCISHTCHSKSQNRSCVISKWFNFQ